MFEKKDTVNGDNGRLGIAKENISEFEDIDIIISPKWNQEEKNTLKNKQSTSKLRMILKR